MSNRALKTLAILAGLAALVWAGWRGWRLAETALAWRHLDATYAESFPAPRELAPNLAGRQVLFHFKTGLDQDDSQICVGFNIVYAALEAGADVTVLFDAGALLDLTDKRHNLASTGVPVRLRKIIAAQVHQPLAEMPVNYKAYLDLLHARGASIYANTAMLIVTGDSDQVERPLAGYAYVEAAPYARIAELLTAADRVVVY